MPKQEHTMMDMDIIKSHKRLVMLGGIDHQRLLFCFYLPFAFSRTCLHDLRTFLFAGAVYSRSTRQEEYHKRSSEHRTSYQTFPDLPVVTR